MLSKWHLWSVEHYVDGAHDYSFTKHTTTCTNTFFKDRDYNLTLWDGIWHLATKGGQ